RLLRVWSETGAVRVASVDQSLLIQGPLGGTDTPRQVWNGSHELSGLQFGATNRTRSYPMTDGDEINRRDFIVTTATIAGSASALAGTTLTTAQAQTLPPPGFDAQEPFAKYWGKELHEVVNVDFSVAAPELASEEVKERHRIYCHLLMRLIVRFWNGNKRGPLGFYPRRGEQKGAAPPGPPPPSHPGDHI